jgi:hypothetical protein
MNPPSLPYHRALRSSFDVTVQFTPSSTGQTVVHRRAHIFILSDLFLVAEWMDASDKAAKAVQVAKEQPERVGQGGPMPEMWLCYPPLAGKHLMVAEGSQGGWRLIHDQHDIAERAANVLTVMILRKETFVIHAESDVARDQIMKDLIDCIDFATNRTSSISIAMLRVKLTHRSLAEEHHHCAFCVFSSRTRRTFAVFTIGRAIAREHVPTAPVPQPLFRLVFACDLAPPV